jgi:hypothetical protein
MKKLIGLFALALFLTACASNETVPFDDLGSTEGTPYLTQAHPRNEGDSMVNAFTWIEPDEPIIENDEITNRTGIRYIEVEPEELNIVVFNEDGSEQIVPWNEQGIEVELQGDLIQISQQEILTRDDVANLANEILVLKQNEGEFSNLLLSRVNFVPEENLWIVNTSYPPDEHGDPMVGSAVHFAINGETGELIRMWVD